MLEFHRPREIADALPLKLHADATYLAEFPGLVPTLPLAQNRPTDDLVVHDECNLKISR